jgi:hypothetical protein
MTSRAIAVPLVVVLLLAGIATICGSLFGGSQAAVTPGRDEPASSDADSSKPDVVSPNDGRVFRVYLDPSGDDANSGRSRDEPIRSLARAEEILTSIRPRTDVEVRIAQGTYVTPPTTWTFFVPNHTVTFLPVDYEVGGGIDSFAGRPVFRGNGESGFWFTARLPRGHPGLDTRLRFYYLQVDEYDRGGIMLNGGTTVVDGRRRPAGEGLNNNTVVGMYFTRLGSQWAADYDGYGGVDLVNSSRNLVQHNHFVGLENKESGQDLIHGVYLAHHSNENVVQGNRFEEVSGDPVRVRNDSNRNQITGNEFRRTGQTAQFSEWFCDTPCAERNGLDRECASHGNVFAENANLSGYFGKEVLNWALMPFGADYPGGSGCDNNGEQRVRTFGNS